MKKTLYALLSAFLVFALIPFASSSDENTTLSFYSFSGVDWIENPGLVAVMDKLKTDLPLVSLELSQAREGEEKMAIMIATNDLPDFLFAHANSYWLTTWNAPINFTEVTDPEILVKYPDFVINSSKVGGKLYAAPLGANTIMGTMYNKGIFAELGLSVPETWDDFLDVCEKLKNAGYIPLANGGNTAWTLQMTPLHKIAAYTVKHPELMEEINANRAKFTDTDVFVTALEETLVLRDRGYYQEGFLSTPHEEAIAMLGTREAAMYDNIAHSVDPLLVEGYPEEEFGMFATPSARHLPAVMTTYGAPGLMVCNSSKNIEAASAYVKAMLSQENLQLFYDKHPVLPVVTGIHMNNPSGINTDAQRYIEANLVEGDFKDILVAASIGPWELWLQGMMAGQMSPAEVVSKIQQEFEANATALKLPGF